MTEKFNEKNPPPKESMLAQMEAWWKENKEKYLEKDPDMRALDDFSQTYIVPNEYLRGEYILQVSLMLTIQARAVIGSQKAFFKARAEEALERKLAKQGVNPDELCIVVTLRKALPQELGFPHEFKGYKVFYKIKK